MDTCEPLVGVNFKDQAELENYIDRYVDIFTSVIVIYYKIYYKIKMLNS